MVKKSKKKKVKVGSGEFWRLCAEVRKNRQRSKAIETAVQEDQAQVATAMLDRKDKTLSNEEYGLQVTVTQNETPQYDGEGIWADLTARERPKCFDRIYDFSTLSQARRAELQKVMFAALTPAEKRMVTVDRLNVVKMSQAVQNGDIAAEKIAPHTTWKKSSPYITVTPLAGD